MQDIFSGFFQCCFIRAQNSLYVNGLATGRDAWNWWTRYSTSCAGFIMGSDIEVTP